MYIIFVRASHTYPSDRSLYKYPQYRAKQALAKSIETHACLLRFDNSAYAYYVMIRESYMCVEVCELKGSRHNKCDDPWYN